MSGYVRLMHKEDITQVVEIDHEAFPTMWPPPNYQHELKNRLAHYIVVCAEGGTVEEPKVATPAEKGISALASMVKRLFNKGLPSSGRQYIKGFAGFWVMADEAHLTNIAVRERHYRQGLGELLLISVIDLATEFNARIITLEVRPSNTAAQNLYYKYGFTRAGLHHGYYIDNKEDAVLMSLGNIMSASFQAKLKRLKKAHSKMWGVPLYQIAR